MWKQPKCASTNKWIKEITHTHTHTREYYSALQMKDVLSYVTSWMDFEDIMLIDVNISQKTNTA